VTRAPAPFAVAVAAAVTVAAGAVIAGPAGAAPDDAVEIADGVPFSALELADALALRAPRPLPAIRVVRVADDAVRLQARGRTRTIRLGTLTGRSAARRVALVALDLLDPPARAADTGAPSPTLVSVRRDAPAPHDRRRAGLLVGVTALVGGDGVAGVGYEVSVPVAGPIRVATAGAVRQRASGPDVSAVQAPVRAGIAARWLAGRWGLELGAGALAAWQRIAADDGGRRLTHSGYRFGAAASGAVSWTIAGPLAIRATGDLEAYAAGRRYLVGGAERLATGPVELWLGIGLAYTPAVTP
jgi:hypothetical protein